LEAWPIVWACAHAGEWRRSHAGSAAQDVVGGIQAEIIAEPKLAAAEAKMDVVTAGAAKSSARTKSKSAAASAKADACVAAAKAESHASVTAAPAKAETHATVTAAAKAKTHAVTAAASTAHRGLRRCRNRQREGERRRGRQKSVHHPVIHAFRPPISPTAKPPKHGGSRTNWLGHSCGKMSLASKKLGRPPSFLLRLCPR
jgi:membrane protein involved in colicin uptake